MEWLLHTYPDTVQASLRSSGTQHYAQQLTTTSSFLDPKQSSATALFQWLVHQHGIRFRTMSRLPHQSTFSRNFLKFICFASHTTQPSSHVKRPCLWPCPCLQHDTSRLLLLLLLLLVMPLVTPSSYAANYSFSYTFSYASSYTSNYVSIYISIYASTLPFMPASLPVCPYTCLSAKLSAYLPVWRSTCLYV